MDEEKVDTLKPPNISRSFSEDSDNSCYTDAKSDIADDDNYSEGEILDYDSDDNIALGDVDVGHGIEMHPYLYRDLENLIFIYGENAVEYRLFESINEIDVDLHIPVSFLEEVVAEAWKVNRNEPLIVRINLSVSSYIETATCPKLEVLQPSKKESFGFGCQVKKFLEQYLFNHWKTMTQEYKKHVEREESLKKSSTFPITLQNNVAFQSLVSDEQVAKMIEMGYDLAPARNALIITHGNIEEALALIATSPSTCESMDPSQLGPVTASTTSDMDTGSLPQQASDSGDEDSDSPDDSKARQNERKMIHKMKRQFSHPPVLDRLKKIFPKIPRLTRTTSMMPGASKQLEDLNLMPLVNLDTKNAKVIPSLADGLLVQLFRYVRQRIPTMNEYCVICDEQHVFQNSAMLKPAVCTRELCVFAFQTLGVMADAAEDIATGAEVVDLLINMTRFACMSGRKERIFDPYPTVVDPKNPRNLLFNPSHKDFKAVEKVLEAIPPMTEMSMATNLLKQKLQDRNPYVYPLIQWIITSNRSHLVKLPEDKQLDFMATPHQFLMVSNPPAKEAVFQEAKRNFGSTFVFHGSSIENWHSIIRQGLVNASGTKLQVNGAAYGSGIYLSPQISTSMGYSKMGYGSHKVKKNSQSANIPKPRFLSSNNITCIAICEVVTSKDLKKNNSIWVCPNADHVTTRFFFVYEDGQVASQSVNTSDKSILEKLRYACYH